MCHMLVRLYRCRWMCVNVDEDPKTQHTTNDKCHINAIKYSRMTLTILLHIVIIVTNLHHWHIRACTPNIAPCKQTQPENIDWMDSGKKTPYDWPIDHFRRPKNQKKKNGQNQLTSILYASIHVYLSFTSNTVQWTICKR